MDPVMAELLDLVLRVATTVLFSRTVFSRQFHFDQRHSFALVSRVGFFDTCRLDAASDSTIRTELS